MIQKTLRNFLIFTFSFQSIFPVLAQAIDPEEVLATVNEQKITYGHLIVAISNLPQEYKNLEDDYLVEMVIDQLVKQEIVAQSLLEENKLTKLLIENEVRSIKARETMETALKGFPSEKQIDAAYLETKKTFDNTEEFHAAHILVESEYEVQELIKSLNNGIEFSQLAIDKSIGPSAPNGGNLGWFSKGQMVPEFELAVLELQLGEISKPVKTQFGWHIIKLNDKRLRELPPIEAVRDKLIQNLQQSFIDDFIREKGSLMTIEKFKSTQSTSGIRDIEILK